ncbi:MAG: EmrB/QacA family drug resistance transporter, partial [Terriglobia bacterium]
LINVARNVGGSVGISLVTTIQARRAQYHQAVLVRQANPYNPAYQQALAHASRLLQSAGVDATDALNKARALVYGEIVRQAAMLSYLDVFWLLSLVCVGMAPLMFLMKKTRPRVGPVSMH